MTATREEVISAFEKVLTELSVVDLESLPADEMMKVSLSEDIGLHCQADYEALSSDLESEGLDISAERLEELDTLDAIYADLTYGRD